MVTTVEESARRLITKHPLRAVFVAIERLNKRIDRGDWRARDFWAEVVHAIHDHARSGELPVGDIPGGSKAGAVSMRGPRASAGTFEKADGD